MPFDPFEEQFDLPAATIKLGDGQRGQIEIVGQKDQMPVVFGIVELDASQVLRVILAGLQGGQYDGLIAAQLRGLVHGARVDSTKEQIEFASDDKERLRLMQGAPVSEVGKAVIHDVKPVCFGYQDVEHIDLVHFAVGDMDEGWNIAAQVDGRGVERIGRLHQFDRKAVAGVKLYGNLDQACLEILIDSSVARFVGVGQCVLGDVATYAIVIELGLMGM
jgi:hypothetical protein